MYTECAYAYHVNVEWDPRKAAENFRKHGVDFADAVIALEDENALTIEDRDHPEQRFKNIWAWDQISRSFWSFMPNVTKIVFVLFPHEGRIVVKLNSIFKA